MARPSLFYILDEVEAALDDANLGRLLGVFEKLRASSQLIVITHRSARWRSRTRFYGSRCGRTAFPRWSVSASANAPTRDPQNAGVRRGERGGARRPVG
jgi:ABC-type lipoprotein export system ATPase subunit